MKKVYNWIPKEGAIKLPCGKEISWKISRRGDIWVEIWKVTENLPALSMRVDIQYIFLIESTNKDFNWMCRWNNMMLGFAAY